VIVLADGTTPSDTLVRDLQDHVKQRTAPYKYPRLVDFVGELPRTPSGKLRRAALRG
jgi:acyl-coenzyme A synthetase/AMP-(fatty) acid ligase